MIIKTRFAPSPTGFLHIGSIRTALYSWLYARQNNGKFILRIEDTDINRTNSKYINHIFYILEWLGLTWDEGPYYQSSRYDFYKDIINLMLKNDLAYKCFCSIKRLSNLRKNYYKNSEKNIYDGFCRNKQFNYNKPYVIRFKNTSYRDSVIFNDIVYKKIKISNMILGDFIIQRSNGKPTYNLCVVLDDNNMNITHVIRGNDHINNTPKQIKIFESLQYNIPIYCHLPMILDNNKQKMSKRSGLCNMEYYINNGFLPEAILNYVIRLGWSYFNEEIFSISKMKYLFNLNKINKSPCRLDNKKMLWINKYYLSSLKYKKLLIYLKPIFEKKKISINAIDNISEIISYFCSKTFLLSEIVDYCNLFVDKKINFNYKKVKFYVSIDIYDLLVFFLKKISSNIVWNLININNLIKLSLLKFNFLNKKIIFKSLRFFITGKEETPNLSIVIYFLKKKKTILRIKNSIKYILKYFSNIIIS